MHANKSGDILATRQKKEVKCRCKVKHNLKDTLNAVLEILHENMMLAMAKKKKIKDKVKTEEKQKYMNAKLLYIIWNAVWSIVAHNGNGAKN